MRKGVLAFGLFFLILGLLLSSCSGIPVKPEPIPQWNEVASSLNSDLVRGNLTEGDKFRVRFQSKTYSRIGPLPDGVGFTFTITSDPPGDNSTVFVPVELGSAGQFMPLEHVEGIANRTGTYTVSVDTLGLTTIIWLAIEKQTYKEPELQYPYTSLFYIGTPIAIGGLITSIWGSKSPKHRHFRHKTHKLKSKDRAKSR